MSLDPLRPAKFICSNGQPHPRCPWAIFQQNGRYYLFHYRTGYQWEIPERRVLSKKTSHGKLKMAIEHAKRHDRNFPHKQIAKTTGDLI